MDKRLDLFFGTLKGLGYALAYLCAVVGAVEIIQILARVGVEICRG